MARYWVITAMAAVALPASAQNTATWLWSVSDTGNGDGLIEPGESALLTLSCGFVPEQPQDGGGFAAAESYGIVGDEAWARGVVEYHESLLWAVYGSGVLHDDNDITRIENYQLPKQFNAGFNADNPIDLYFIRWTPDSYDGRLVTLDSGGAECFVYVDPMGSLLLDYEGTGGVVTFRVAPSPGVLVVAGAGALAGGVFRRRR